MTITIDDIHAARHRIAPFVHITPVMTCRSLDALADCRIVLKCENLQKTGAFKVRGAHNAVLSLTDQEASRGVVTHSSGNHGQAIALAARSRGITATIVMPDNSVRAKCDAVVGYGGRIVFCKPTHADRNAVKQRVIEETGAVLVHPYDNEAVIAGQGTCAMELLEQVADLDAIVAPVSGGGLLAGTLIAAKAINPDIRVIAAEPEQADDAYRSWKAGRITPIDKIDTIADGLRAQVGEITFPIIRDLVDEIITVSEQSIIDAMRLLWSRSKLLVEPSGAVPLAALLRDDHPLRDAKVGLILSGGNVDLDNLPWDTMKV